MDSSTELPPGPAVRHTYPLTVERADLSVAFGLLLKTFPYALVRLGILVGCTIGAILCWVVAFGGAAFLSRRVGGAAGTIWLVICAAGAGSIWWYFLRYILYLAKCGHIAVLTQLLMHGRIDQGGEGMFAYGRHIVTSRFAEVNVLFAMDLLVKGVVRAFNRTLDWVAGLLPGLDGLAQIANAVVRAATSYIDETLFSYSLARTPDNPWECAKDGLIYYCQNAREVLKTAVWVVILDKVLTFAAWIVCLVPAFAIASSVQGSTGTFAIGVGLLLALNVRSALLKPLFLIMVMTKFHVAVRNQPIDATWDARLSGASEQFRQITEKARTWAAGGAPPPATTI